MKRSIYLGGLIIIALILVIFSNKIGQLYPQQEIENIQGNADVVLIVESGPESQLVFQDEFETGMTVFSLLKEKAEGSGLLLETKFYDIGVMIEAIGGKENGQEGKYWLYYINGEMPMVSADKQELKPGDKVEFKFEESSF